MLNRVTLIGRLGATPELMTTKKDTSMLRFSLATSESYMDKATGQREERTQWHRIVTFGPFAETMGRCLDKGMLVLVEGKIQTNKVLKDDGTYTYYTNIIANNIRRLGSVQAATSKASEQSYDDECESAFDSDDIPF